MPARPAALIVPLLALAACGGPDRAGNSAAAMRPPPHGTIAKVKALTPQQREGVLFRAILSSGAENCQDVKQVEDQPPAKTGEPMWRVTCSDGSQHMVEIQDDGTALVTSARSSS